MADGEGDALHDPKLGIELSINRVCCPRHREPFREEWPKGWMPFSLALLQAGLASETLIDECEQDVNLVNGALDRVPLCERVPPATLQQAYIDCGLGCVSKCENCGAEAQGVRMRLLEPGAVVPSMRDHVCFECIAMRLRTP